MFSGASTIYRDSAGMIVTDPRNSTKFIIARTGGMPTIKQLMPVYDSSVRMIKLSMHARINPWCVSPLFSFFLSGMSVVHVRWSVRSSTFSHEASSSSESIDTSQSYDTDDESA